MRRPNPWHRPRVLGGITAGSLVAATLSLAAATPAAPAASPDLSRLSAAQPAEAREHPPKDPVAIGSGGAVTSVDPYATSIGIEVLRRGGNATDAAVATAAALGVTEPYSAGVGGGGFFVHYNARTGNVQTIDGRETAPMAMPTDAFIDPDTGEPYPFFPDLVTSGVSVGVPGTPATWDVALDSWGTMSLRQALRPAARLAQRGFVVDQTFHDQTAANAERFGAIRPTVKLFLPGGEPPAVGSVFKNKDLADTYRLIARQGVDVLYEGRLAREIVRVVQDPPTTRGTDLPVPPGFMEQSDLLDYHVRRPRATHIEYRGLDVYGMPPPSSGGSTVGEALNILEQFDLSQLSTVEVLHLYLEASALAFADRAKYLGDSEFVDVPLQQILSDGFAAERACEIDPAEAAVKPVAAGEADGEYDTECGTSRGAGSLGYDGEGPSTTHLTVADRWGNVVAYTLTIEQTGGSGITVPRRGFLLNNELTDFTTVYDPDDPNRIQPGKRPRSSMAPTIVLRDGEPWLALGSPGGSTIITTVLQVLLNRVDLRHDLLSAVAAPRASQRNTASVSAEPGFTAAYGEPLEALEHSFTPISELGAATAIEFTRRGQLIAVAEPIRRGGGDAQVVRPRRR
jgi:gamma-glutamyltranspeptidase/glutathione hydrolase